MNLIRLNAFCETFTQPIVVHSNVQIISLVRCDLPSIEHLNCRYIYDILINKCTTPYDEDILNNSAIQYYRRNEIIIKHINKTNAYNTYIHYGTIPKRIRLNLSDVETMKNPIIIALNLGSNYPRRMAEFMSYI